MRRHKLRTIWNNLIFFVCCMLVVNCSDGDDGGGGDTPHEGNINANNVLTEQHTASVSDAKALKIAKRLEVPKLKGAGNYFIIHESNDIGVNFVTEWDYELDTQRWSAFTMYYFGKNNTNVSGTAGRYDEYLWDEDIEEKYYTKRDYFYGSGYDHGHVLASYDRQTSTAANRQTFYMTNMQPMWNRFNAGIWGKMEGKVRSWNTFKQGSSWFADTLYVVRGGTIDKSEHIIERVGGHLIVPKYYYMAVLCKNNKTGEKNNYGYKAMAFWIEHENINRVNNDLQDYVISIDELEKKTKIDFFCNLPDYIEDAVEKDVVLSAWNW